MFRRRTDQVYATLQQVQRRITEQAGNPSSPAVPPGAAGAQPASDHRPPPGVSPFTSPLQEALGRQSKAGLVSLQPEPGPPLANPFPPLPRGDVFLSVSKQLALTLIALWIATCVCFFWLGSHASDRHGTTPGEGYAPGDAGNRDIPVHDDQSVPTKPLGDDLLVLMQVPEWTADIEQQYRDRATQFNGIMAKNASRGWKPWFGIRKPPSGALQLVFGEVADNVYGIPKKDYMDFARMMAQPPPHGGGFADAKWLTVR